MIDLSYGLQPCRWHRHAHRIFCLYANKQIVACTLRTGHEGKGRNMLISACTGKGCVPCNHKASFQRSTHLTYIIQRELSQTGSIRDLNSKGIISDQMQSIPFQRFITKIFLTLVAYIFIITIVRTAARQPNNWNAQMTKDISAAVFFPYHFP